jgi:hypothetical protein
MYYTNSFFHTTLSLSLPQYAEPIPTMGQHEKNIIR